MNFLNAITTKFMSYFKSSALTGGNPEAMARLSQAAMALTFFEGYAPQTVAVDAGKPDDNIHINFAEVIVSKGVAFLFGEPLKITIGTDQDKTAEQQLEALWPEDARAEDLTEMATEGAISGDAYLKISIGTDGRPSVSVCDPNTIQVETDPHDVTVAQRYTVQYEIPGESGRAIVYREETVRSADGRSWQIQESHSYDGGTRFSPVGDLVSWNFSFPPIFHAKNMPKSKSYNGRADLRHDVLALINAISRVDSLCNKVVRVHSTPKPYATGLRKQDLEMGTDKMMFLPGGLAGAGTAGIEAKIGLLEMKGDLSGARDFRRELREGLAEMSRVPEVACGKVETTGALSGVALRILYGPLLDQTKVKRRSYGKLIKDVVAALMVLAGRANDAGAITIHWSDPLPANEVEAVAVAEGKRRLGVSQDTLISELGYDPEAEREKRARGDQNLGEQLLTAFDKGQGAELALQP
jgi:hypothetical protein